MYFWESFPHPGEYVFYTYQNADKIGNTSWLSNDIFETSVENDFSNSFNDLTKMPAIWNLHGYILIFDAIYVIVFLFQKTQIKALLCLK